MHGCIIPAGSLITSGFVLYIYFWLIYVSHLALRLCLPLKSARLFNTDHSRIIYSIEVTIVLLISTLPSLVSAGLGRYRIDVFPPIYCLLDKQTYRLLVTIVPVLIGGCACVIVMLLILYTIHMVSLTV